MFMSADKVNFGVPVTVPASGDFKESKRVEVTDGVVRFWLQSDNVDLTKFPVLEPVAFTANFTRVSGAKGFFIFTVNQVSVTPVGGKK